MKKEILFLILFLSCQDADSQKESLHKGFLRMYEDNDALNISNKSTDWGYTNGMRLDFFYTPKKNRKNFFTLFNQLAGKNSTTVSGWGVMQVMIAPKKTSLSIPDKNDYSYAGGLYCIHTIHSGNETKKINVQSEWIAGLMGPPSFAEESQIFFHRLIKDPLPRGWNYQLPTDLLLNYNVKAEKQIAAYKMVSLIGRGEMFCGSMLDGISLHLLLKLEGSPGYFSGLINQCFATHRKKPKLLITLRSTVDFIAYNALLEGGLFNKRSPVNDKNAESGTLLRRQRVGCSLDLFILASFRGFSISFTQKTISTEFKGYGRHTIGNISIYKTLQ